MVSKNSGELCASLKRKNTSDIYARSSLGLLKLRVHSNRLLEMKVTNDYILNYLTCSILYDFTFVFTKKGIRLNYVRNKIKCIVDQMQSSSQSQTIITCTYSVHFIYAASYTVTNSNHTVCPQIFQLNRIRPVLWKLLKHCLFQFVELLNRKPRLFSASHNGAAS